MLPEADLRWLLLSESLMSGQGSYACGVVAFSADERQQISSWLDQVDRDPRALHQHLASAQPATEIPLRIGRYAERLLQFFLLHGPTHRLVACNLVVRKRTSEDPARARDHTTLGEIDFLLENVAGEKLHWELALKYFLALDVPAPRVIDYLGPDGTEALGRKIEKLQRQLRQVIPAPYDDRVWQPQGFTRGRLFYRATPRELPLELNPTHLRGFWLPFEQLADGPDHQRYVLLTRGQWLASRRWSSALTGSELAEQLSARWVQQGPAIAARKSAGLSGQMIALVVADPSAGDFTETARGLVMPPAFAMHRPVATAASAHHKSLAT
ncbi:MAG: DUF1853 family protein [Kofleriaceae bacterium]|nr:DUF1853 family protein [Kofleriaceae bacterium]